MGFQVGAVDCTIDQSICQKYGVKGYPTIKFFRNGKPKDYQGVRTNDKLTFMIIGSHYRHISSFATSYISYYPFPPLKPILLGAREVQPMLQFGEREMRKKSKGKKKPKKKAPKKDDFDSAQYDEL